MALYYFIYFSMPTSYNTQLLFIEKLANALIWIVFYPRVSARYSSPLPMETKWINEFKLKNPVSYLEVWT